jgi:hypothetical protein
MQNLLTFFAGKKTYLVSIGALVYAVGIHLGWWQHSADIDIVFGSSAALTIRAAIKKLCAQIAADPALSDSPISNQRGLITGRRILPLLVGALCLVTMTQTSSAGEEAAPLPTPAPLLSQQQQQIVDELHADFSAHAFELSFAPIYAPKLANHWGASIALTHPIGSINNFGSFVGLRGDFLDKSTFVGSASVGAKADFNVLGHTVTPFTIAGVVAPLSGAGDKTLSAGAIVGAGLKADLWHDAKGNIRVSAFSDVEYWSQYPGIQIYHLGAQLSCSW